MGSEGRLGVSGCQYVPYMTTTVTWGVLWLIGLLEGGLTLAQMTVRLDSGPVGGGFIVQYALRAFELTIPHGKEQLIAVFGSARHVHRNR